MTLRIEDYALIGDCKTAALVGRDGSIDWLCWPRFDSTACFAVLLGDADNGRWLIAPKDSPLGTRRRYRPGTLVLETEFKTETGTAAVIDFMPPADGADLVRIVAGRSGRVVFKTELVVRFNYGAAVPWVNRLDDGSINAVARPERGLLRAPVTLFGEDLRTLGEFAVQTGQFIPFVLSYGASFQSPPPAIDPFDALARTEAFWRQWSNRCPDVGPWTEAVTRSLIVLKGLTYAPTGGIVAAATTSLPEEIGGVRNWDYRYCWLRDATLTLVALVNAGYQDEAKSWREWLLRAIAGSADQMQIMYGVRGERRLEELEIPWLSGYENSKPVRIGNAASGQFQLDVYGEVLGTMYRAHEAGIKNRETDWRLQVALVDFLESNWHKPDEGIWEVRGGPKHFTHSQMMAWVAFDRAVKLVDECGCTAAERVGRWRKIRDQIHADVCARGFSRTKKAFTQYYGSDALDASLLMMPLAGFLPFTDKRIRGTIEAIERELTQDGFVVRYRPEEEGVDGLPGREGVFLPCSFWMVSCLHGMGRKKEARELFERLLSVRNDLGLLSEEYDPRSKRQLGNFPQAFSHVSLVNAALTLTGQWSPARKRRSR